MLFVPLFLLLLRMEASVADWVPMLAVLCLGICTGYIGCMAFVLGAERDAAPGLQAVEQQLKARSGSFISFSLMIGLSSGSLIALGLASLVASVQPA